MGGTTGLAGIARAVTIAQQEESNRQSQRERETSFPGLARDDLVTSAYRDILGRNPEPAGFQHSTNAMIGGMTGGDLVRGFIGTPEFQQAQDYQRAFTRAFRPGYEQFGPNQQFYPSIYRPGYTDYGIEGAVNFPRPAYGYDESLYQSNDPIFSTPAFNSPQTNDPIFSTPAFNSPQTEITMGNLPPGGFYKGGQVDDGIASLLKR
jgi:hypothetical protein